MKYDIIIIGSGYAGFNSALEGARKGYKILVIEKDEPGGTCVNKGCVPTKIFYRYAKTIFKAQKDELKIESLPSLNKLINKRNSVIESIKKGISYLFRTNKVDFLKGKADVNDSGEVIINNTHRYKTKKIILAMGSKPVIRFKPHTVSPEEFILFENYPEDFVIIGGGIIGIEIASIFSLYNFKITIIEKEKSILPFLDEDIVKPVKKFLLNRGVEILENTEVVKIEESRGNKKIITISNGETIETGLIVESTGRVPADTPDFLKKDSKGFLLVDNNYMTNIENIYAIGDLINRGKMFAHYAGFQGKEVINRIYGDGGCIDVRVPYGIFSFPQIAGWGLQEKDLIQNNKKYRVEKIPFFSSSIGKIMDERAGFIKIIYDGNKKIAGIHIVGEEAIEMINILSSFSVHPSFGELIDELRNKI